MAQFDPAEWARQQFFRADFEHASRNERATLIASRMIVHPEVSIPRFCQGNDEIDGAYRFFANEAIDYRAVLSGHIRDTCEHCSGRSSVLVVQDTTTASYGGKTKRKELGPVSDSNEAQGLLVHSALALSEQGEILGVLGLQIWARCGKPKPKDETSAQRRKRDRESQRWYQVEQEVARNLAEFAVKVPSVIAVFDREGDVFDAFYELQRLSHGFVIRATHNRLVENDGTSRYSLDEVRQAPVVTELELEVPARPGQTARVARLQVRAVDVQVMPPSSANRKGAPLPMNIVLVDEIDPPSKKQALCWYLLTTESIATVQDVLRIVQIYRYRWRIEEFHMGLKTGCAIEERQLDGHGLRNFIAMASSVAVKVLQLRDLSRRAETVPASEVLNPVQLDILRESNPKLQADCSVRQALHAIAKLGGFVGTNRNAQPGWRTIWRGFMDLLNKEQGYRLALAHQAKQSK